MKEKILLQLVAKHQGKPKALLGLLAEKLAAKVTEESEIEGAIDELDNMPFSIDDYADFLQKESDRRVTEAVAKAKQKGTPQDSKSTKVDNDPEPDKDDDDDIKSLIKGLAKEVSAMKAEKAQSTIKSKVQSQLDKSIPEALYKGRIPENEDDIPAFIEEVTSDWAAIKQSVSGEVLGGDPPPSGAQTKPATAADKALDADVASFAKKKVEQFKSQQNGT